MIRQAISCDICGAEKKETNHWFVAYVHAGELRISGWSAQGKLRSGSKHLCGQTCLNKLVDEFVAKSVARSVANRAQAPTPEAVEARQATPARDASLTSRTAYPGATSAQRALPVPEFPSRPVVSAAVIAIAPPRAIEEARTVLSATPVENSPNYASRRWRAEAWERERERERRSGLAAHRKTL